MNEEEQTGTRYEIQDKRYKIEVKYTIQCANCTYSVQCSRHWEMYCTCTMYCMNNAVYIALNNISYNVQLVQKTAVLLSSLSLSLRGKLYKSVPDK